jgi:lambda repressor-like predicted transcriptional regulator
MINKFDTNDDSQRFESLKKNMEKIDFECNAISNNLESIVKDQQFIKEQLSGTSIGKIQEILTLSDLKRAYPQDSFSDETSDKHGTDIVATIREKGLEMGNISISVKHHRKWSSEFITQLENNIKQDNTKWGFLVTVVFPTEALNKKIWSAINSNGRIILIVKPEFAPIAYYAFRTILIYEEELRASLKSILEKMGLEKNG